MTKQINFDMDGTIADFYGVEGWLSALENELLHPYIIAKPLVNMARLAKALHKAQRNGYTVNIISWVSMTASETFKAQIIEAKTNWLQKHLPSVTFDNIFITDYGISKKEYGTGILFDDNSDVRSDWGENAYEPSEIFDVLKTL